MSQLFFVLRVERSKNRRPLRIISGTALSFVTDGDSLPVY